MSAAAPSGAGLQPLGVVSAAKVDEPIGPVLRNGTAPVCVRLAEQIEKFAEELPLLGQAPAYQTWARTVARYSFESYALFGDEPAGEEQG